MESISGRLCSLRGEDLNSSNSYYTQRSDSAISRKLTRMTGSLEILDEGLVKPTINCCSNSQLMSPADSSANSRPVSGMSNSRPGSRASTGSVPPRSDSSMSRRINTPIKQVSLQAVPRKAESGDLFGDSVCWNSVRLEPKEKHSRQLKDKSANAVHLKANTLESAPAEGSDSHQLETVTQLSMCRQILSATEPPQADPLSGMQVDQVSDVGWDTSSKDGAFCGEDEPSDDKEEEEEEDTSSGEDEEDSDEEDKKLVAPNELLMEFVDSLMRKEYQIADKLCKMILLFEPENAEALKFQPLIKEKLELDAEVAKAAALEEEDDEDENDSEGDDDSDDEEDDDDDDNEDDSGESEESSSSGDEGTSSSEDSEQPTETKSQNSAS